MSDNKSAGKISPSEWEDLNSKLKGELFYDHGMRTIYSTDASSYRVFPQAVAMPRDAGDMREIVGFSKEKNVPITPRAAGTSLSGQPVGDGIVVDVGRHMTKVLEINKEEGWVRLEPGVIRNELNELLAPHGLFFGPETSTQNRAMIGGMMGNNSCGANSVVYRDSRRHLLEVKGFLADGSEVTFGELTRDEYEAKLAGDPSALETKLYLQINEMLASKDNLDAIVENFPSDSIFRRNTGYALDVMAKMEPFTEGGEPFNFCKLIAGSSGTLVFIYELKVNAEPLPPEHRNLVCINFKTLDASLRANIAVCKHEITACELIDDYTIECARENPLLSDELFFVKDKPGAVLLIVVAKDTE